MYDIISVALGVFLSSSTYNWSYHDKLELAYDSVIIASICIHNG
jgi:hypothetical protein